MKLALDHIETEQKSNERQLTEAREGLKAAQRTLDEQTAKVARLIQRNHDLTEALTVLRHAAKEGQKVEEQKRSDEQKAAERMPGKLSLRQRPDAMASKISEAR
jgi:cysteinyl-tRNA synthetase